MEAFISKPHVKLKERMSGRVVKGQAGGTGGSVVAVSKLFFNIFYYSSHQIVFTVYVLGCVW